MNRIQNDILNTIKNDDGILLIDLLNKLKYPPVDTQAVTLDLVCKKLVRKTSADLSSSHLYLTNEGVVAAYSESETMAELEKAKAEAKLSKTIAIGSFILSLLSFLTQL